MSHSGPRRPRDRNATATPRPSHAPPATARRSASAKPYLPRRRPAGAQLGRELMRAIPQADRADEHQHRHPAERGAEELAAGHGEQSSVSAEQRCLRRCARRRASAARRESSVPSTAAAAHRRAADGRRTVRPQAAAREIAAAAACRRRCRTTSRPRSSTGRGRRAPAGSRRRKGGRGRIASHARYGPAGLSAASASGRSVTCRECGPWRRRGGRYRSQGTAKEKGSRSCLSRSGRRTGLAPALSRVSALADQAFAAAICAFAALAVRASRTRAWCGRGRLRRVALAELVDAAGGVHHLLFAGVERVTGRAHFDVERLDDRRAGRERVAATARNLDVAVIRVDAGFHGVLFLGPRTGASLPVGVRPDRRRNSRGRTARSARPTAAKR